MELLTVNEVAKIAKVSDYTTRQWLKKGILKGIKPGGKGWRIPKESLNEFMNNSA